MVAILITPNATNDTTDYAVSLAGKDRLVEALVSITSARQAFLVNFKTIFSNSTPTQ